MIGLLGAVLTRRVAAVALQTALTAAVAAGVSSGFINYDAVCSVATL